MNIALSSIKIEKKVIKLKSIWDLIDEKKLRMTKDGRFDRNKTNGKNKNKGGGCCIVM